MGLSFRKSIKIGKNTRINLSKTGGIGISTGVKGARISVNKRGARTTVSKGDLQYSKNYSFKNKTDQENKQYIQVKKARENKAALSNQYNKNIVWELEHSRPKTPEKIIKWLFISIILTIVGLIFPPVLLLAIPSIVITLMRMFFSKEFRSSCIGQRAIDFYKKGQYEKSKNYCYKALKIFEGNISAKNLLSILEVS